MIEGIPTTSILILGLILLPILLLPQLKGWISNGKSSSSANLNLLPRLRLWSWGPKQSSEIISLRMYPIKSCRGFEVQQATLKEHGLALDRRWMIIDSSKKNEFITIRQNAKMTLIKTGLSDDGQELIVSVPSPESESCIVSNMNSIPIEKTYTTTIRIPAYPTPEWLQANTTIANVNIWGEDTDGYIYAENINAVFSAFLDRPVALVYKGPTARIVQGNGAPKVIGRVQTIGFPDEFPVLIASEASLKELNTRLRVANADPITVERFRPNIVVKGQKAWSEDLWKLVRIRDVGKTSGVGAKNPLVMDIVTRCGRCQVPNVDPDSAVKNKRQPWDTLMSYRRVDPGLKYKPCFGMMAAPRNEGVIEVGMRVEVLEETTKHRYMSGGI
ncbi:Molybdenum cofactor sulfurase C-terminal [Penicillium herquei]|nr:Molybdenum cofactor sulfurase C-terminal [Penicillium herquei]